MQWGLMNYRNHQGPATTSVTNAALLSPASLLQPGMCCNRGLAPISIVVEQLLPFSNVPRGNQYKMGLAIHVVQLGLTVPVLAVVDQPAQASSLLRRIHAGNAAPKSGIKITLLEHESHSIATPNQTNLTLYKNHLLDNFTEGSTCPSTGVEAGCAPTPSPQVWGLGWQHGDDPAVLAERSGQRPMAVLADGHV